MFLEVSPRTVFIGMTPEALRHRREYNRNYVAARYEERRKLIDEIKVSRGCCDCGYNTHPAALQFDHIDASGKSFKNRGGDDAKLG